MPYRILLYATERKRTGFRVSEWPERTDMLHRHSMSRSACEFDHKILLAIHQMSVLIILSPHLVERIEAFLKVGDDVEPSCRLAESCTTQLELAVRAFQTQAGTNSTKKGTAREIVGARPGEADDGNNGSEADHTDTQSGSPPESAPAPAPAVIDEDALIQLSQWALSDLGMVILKRKGLGMPVCL